MSFRSHVGREFPSSSSSLSPLAPPFMVERSNFSLIHDPAMDFPGTPFSMALSGSLRSTGSETFGLEFSPNPVMKLDKSLNPNSKTHEYLSWKAADSVNTSLPPLNPDVTASEDPFLLGQGCYSVAGNPVEAKPYYHLYFEPAIRVDSTLVSPDENWSTHQKGGSSHGVYDKKLIDSDPTPEWGGWTNEWRSGWTDWNQGKGKASDLFGSFSSKESNVTGSENYENFVSKGGAYYDTQDLSNSTKFLNSNSINMHVGEKPTIAVRAHQSDDKSFLGNDCFSLQADLSVQPQPEIASEVLADSGNHQMSYNSSCSKHLSHHHQPYSFRIGSSGAKTGVLNDLVVGSAAEDTSFRCSNSFKMNMPSSLPNFENQTFLDSSKNSVHLEKNWVTSSGNDSETSNKVVSKDLLAHTFLENCENDISHASADFPSLALNTNRSVSSAEKSFDVIGRNNAAVDSPCWKGAPTSKHFPFEASDIVSTKYVKKYEENYGYNDQLPHCFLFGIDDNLQSCTRNRKNNTMYDVREHLEDSLAASMGSSMLSFASEGCTSDGTMKVGLCSRVHVPTDIHERTAVHAVATNVVEDYNMESFTPEQQSSAKLKMTHEEKYSSNYYPADADINKCSPSERIEIHASERALSSPSSPKEVPTRPAESDLEESHPKVDVQNLIKTMHNLSELIYFHCLNGPIELKEHEQNLLNNVVGNIDACLLKNVKQITPEKETAFSQSDRLQSIEASVEDHQIKSSGRPHLTKEMSELSQTHLGKLNVKEVTEHCCKFRESIAQSISARDTAKMMKEDNMIKEMKRILDENLDDEVTEPQASLYRNLWLEAEASFCSINYKTRFNCIKNEMEKCSDQLEVSENTSGTKKLPDPGVFLNSGEDSGSPTVAKNDLCHYPAAKSSPPSNANKHVNDVLFRFHILKSRDNDSFVKDSNMEESSDFRSSDDHNKADEPTDLEKGSVKSVDLFQDSLFSGSKDTTEDVKGSVMARFNILKSRTDHLSVDKSNWPIMTKIGEDDMLDEKMDKVPVLQGSYTVGKISTPQEPHLHMEEEQGPQSFAASCFDLLLPSSCYDGTSSDWEHVSEEEFAGLHHY